MTFKRLRPPWLKDMTVKEMNDILGEIVRTTEVTTDPQHNEYASNYYYVALGDVDIKGVTVINQKGGDIYWEKTDFNSSNSIKLSRNLMDGEAITITYIKRSPSSLETFRNEDDYVRLPKEYLLKLIETLCQRV